MSTESHFGRWLRRTIEGTGQSLRQFSAAAGIPYPTLRRWIAANHPAIRGYSLARLASGLGVPREEIESQLNPAVQAAH
jgi:transcriptional regulator with XRE-family HTH domain